MLPATDLFHDAQPIFTVYRSGASSRADATGYAQAGAPIGINALDASAAVLELLGGYATSGGLVFCDSGAFGCFKSSTSLPFGKVLAVYHRLIEHTDQPSNLLVVAPDQVGDQSASFAMLIEWREEMAALAAAGVSVMVPYQAGGLSLPDYHKRVRLLLGFDYVVGLPSNAEAIPESDVLEFMRCCQPGAVHFLGCRETALLHKAAFAAPQCRISSDSTRLRSQIGQGRALTVAHQEHAGELLINALHGYGKDLAQYDETEMAGSLDELIPALGAGCLKRLADRIGLSPRQLKSAASEGQVWELIEDAVGGYGDRLVSLWWTAEVNAITSPLGRTAAVEQLAREGVI